MKVWGILRRGHHLEEISRSQTSATQLLEVVCWAALATAGFKCSLCSLQLPVRCIPLPQQLIYRLRQVSGVRHCNTGQVDWRHAQHSMLASC